MVAGGGGGGLAADRFSRAGLDRFSRAGLVKLCCWSMRAAFKPRESAQIRGKIVPRNTKHTWLTKLLTESTVLQAMLTTSCP